MYSSRFASLTRYKPDERGHAVNRNFDSTQDNDTPRSIPLKSTIKLQAKEETDSNSGNRAARFIYFKVSLLSTMRARIPALSFSIDQSERAISPISRNAIVFLTMLSFSHFSPTQSTQYIRANAIHYNNERSSSHDKSIFIIS